METSPLEATPNLSENPEAKAPHVNTVSAIAAGTELGRKIVECIRKSIGLDLHQAHYYPISSQSDQMHVGLEYSHAISPCTPKPAQDDGLISVTDRELRACILKQGLLATFSAVLAVVFCTVMVAIPSADVQWVGSHGKGLESHVGGFWASHLHWFLGLCLCLLGLTRIYECEQPKNCNRCQDVAKSSVIRVEEAEQKAQKAHHSKQQFMAYVFHNIRVPFNAIVLGLGHLRSNAEKKLHGTDASESMDLIQMMLDCAETMTSVLDDVTDMGHWEKGAMELNLEEFDLFGLVKFLVWGLKDFLYQKQMRFSMRVDPLAKAVLSSNHVLGDKHRVLQTLGNFISNAVKFSPAGGYLELSIKCEEVFQSDASVPCKCDVRMVGSDQVRDFSHCTCFRAEDLSKKHAKNSLKPSHGDSRCDQRSFAKVLITVKDTSNGILAQDEANIFEPLSFVSSGWVVQKAGMSGLGLSMAKQFVEQSGGYIGVDSKEGEGNMFYFCIPYPLIPINYSVKYKISSKEEGLDAFTIENSEDSRTRESGTRDTVIIEEEKVAQSPLDGGKGGRRVLLVEDTKINRIVLKKVLHNLNLICEEAENGQVAVNLLKQGRMYDLILMDKEMPIMDGHEATRQLRLMGIKTPIVALTGNALQTDRELFLKAGVDDFQTKPLSRDKLVRVLARFGVEISCA